MIITHQSIYLTCKILRQEPEKLNQYKAQNAIMRNLDESVLEPYLLTRAFSLLEPRNP